MFTAVLQVLGIDRFNSISNENSSHHGHTRITRMAYMEGPEYVPLLKKSFELYRQLEQETGQVDTAPIILLLSRLP